MKNTHTIEYSLRQQELALGFLTFGQSQDDPIVGKLQITVNFFLLFFFFNNQRRKLGAKNSIHILHI